MPEPQEQDPLEIPVPDTGENTSKYGGSAMSADLNALLMAEGAKSHQLMMLESQGNIQNVNNLLRLTAAKKFDELQPAESKAIDTVLSSPPIRNQG